jgi:hypothetical protein
MTPAEFEKERKRREVENDFFSCPCGKRFIGKNIDFKNHLNLDCTMFKKAGKNLTQKK